MRFGMFDVLGDPTDKSDMEAVDEWMKHAPDTLTNGGIVKMFLAILRAYGISHIQGTMMLSGVLGAFTMHHINHGREDEEERE